MTKRQIIRILALTLARWVIVLILFTAGFYDHSPLSVETHFNPHDWARCPMVGVCNLP